MYLIRLFLVGALSLGLGACGGGGGGGGGSQSSGEATAEHSVPVHKIGGSISGLTSAGLVLANGAETVALPGGSSSFSFAGPVAEGHAYSVTVASQPAGQVCTINNGAGTVGSTDVSNMTLSCESATFSLGGSISSLSTAGLTISDGIDALPLSAGQKTFTFPSLLPYGAAYTVSVTQQPVGQNCAVSNGSGSVSGNTASVAVTCVAALLPGAENLPSLATPDAGSTVAAGNGVEGLYTGGFDLAFIGSAGAYVHSDLLTFSSGSISFSGNSWDIVSGFNFNNVGGSAPLSGSGTVVPFMKLSGVENGRTVNLNYAVENALAVSQDALQGRWVSTPNGFDITVDSNGNFDGTTTGAFGTCSVSGKMLLTSPLSHKNLYAVTLNASGGSGCWLDTTSAHTGFAAIGFYQVSSDPANGYKRQLSIAASSPGGGWFKAFPRKQ
jgi:hypothetical protein